jgi:hypothetical protein
MVQVDTLNGITTKVTVIVMVTAMAMAMVRVTDIKNKFVDLIIMSNFVAQ